MAEETKKNPEPVVKNVVKLYVVAENHAVASFGPGTELTEAQLWPNRKPEEYAADLARLLELEAIKPKA